MVKKMPKSLAASQKVMRSYLSELLTDEDTEQAAQKTENKQLESLLKNVAEPAVELPIEKKILSRKPKVQTDVKHEVTTQEDEPLLTKKSAGDLQTKVQRDYRKGSFQAMFFDVAGLTIAVPLIELGGIHNVEKTNSLVGKPDWFKGVMVHREDQINVVDTAQWVMPEKCDDNLKDSLNYQYIIMLSNSSWGLMAEHLVDTVTLQQEDVKWLDSAKKRPWLAGLVKDRMCALLDVEAMIKLLDEGSGI